jgi:uncharacterized metal-binding protein YceD (DUF177 family)
VRVKLELSPEHRAALAAENGLASVEDFRLEATVKGLKGRKLLAQGMLRATVTYICGVSLRPFAVSLEVPFEQLYGSEPQPKEVVDIDPLDESDLEPLVDGAVRIADLGYQLFTLALDPYPRHPDLVGTDPLVEDDEDEPEKASPFAVLKDLKL